MTAMILISLERNNNLQISVDKANFECQHFKFGLTTRYADGKRKQSAGETGICRYLILLAQPGRLPPAPGTPRTPRASLLLDLRTLREGWIYFLFDFWHLWERWVYLKSIAVEFHTRSPLKIPSILGHHIPAFFIVVCPPVPVRRPRGIVRDPVQRFMATNTIKNPIGRRCFQGFLIRSLKRIDGTSFRRNMPLPASSIKRPVMMIAETANVVKLIDGIRLYSASTTVMFRAPFGSAFVCAGHIAGLSRLVFDRTVCR